MAEPPKASRYSASREIMFALKKPLLGNLGNQVITWTVDGLLGASLVYVNARNARNVMGLTNNPAWKRRDARIGRIAQHSVSLCLCCLHLRLIEALVALIGLGSILSGSSL